ncbi:hypothetical protein H0H92_004789 [Tricholoma furcatifolium]|nr:hypothetical protein H0H92_004789 [Tricholoma furcatifolium]
MPQKKTKNKPAEKKPDKKDEKKESIQLPPAPAPAPAEPVEPEPEPIPVPEPIPLPVPAPIGKRHPDDTNSGHERADHIIVQDRPTAEPAHDGWDHASGGGWGANNDGWGEGSVSGGNGWQNNDGWGEGGGGYGSNGEDGETVYDDSGWEQADTAHGQEQHSSQEHAQDQAPLPVPPPPNSQPAPTQSTLPHDWSSASVQQATVAPPPPHATNAPPAVPKAYISASAMANRNRNRPPSAPPPPAPSKPSSFFWAPNQPPPPKQPISTTKGQHNPGLKNLSPWGEPKNVDPWGDPKPQPNPPPTASAPPKPPSSSGQARPAWHQWGRQPQPAVSAPRPAAKQQPVRMAYSYDYEYDDDDDEYTDDEDIYDGWEPPSQRRVGRKQATRRNRPLSSQDDGWGQSSHGQHGWGSDPRKQVKVNYAAPSSEDGWGTTSKPALSSTEYSHIANTMLHNVPQGHAGHHPQHHGHHSNNELSHHQLERAWRLQQLEEQRRMEQMHEQQAMQNQKSGKSSKKSKQKNNEWEGGGWGTDMNGWGQTDGGKKWGQSDDGWGHSGNGRGNGNGDGWGNQEDNGWGNSSGANNGWGNSDGGGGWGNDDGWGKNSGDHGWDNGGDERGNSGGRKQKHKHQDDGWGNQDNSWSNARGSTNEWGNDGWGGGGDEDEQESWDEEEDEGWGERYHVVTDAAAHKTSQTLMHAMDASKPKASKGPTISSMLGLPEGSVNESNNLAFKDAQRAIFGKDRMARDRIHWSYSPENEAQVTSVIGWIMAMESYLAVFGLLKFLETKERGALFVNVNFRLEEYPSVPAFDWLTYDQVQLSTDRILQHSILACDPANQTLVFIYLLSWTGNSVAMWRRKLQVPKEVRQKYLQVVGQVKGGLRPDKEYRIHVDELPPTDKKKGGKLTKSAVKQGTKIAPSKAAPAKADNVAKSKKPAKSALKAHQRGQSLSAIPEKPEKKRKWWQFLRFND